MVSGMQTRVPVLDEVALGWASRVVWAVCVGVYLTVFVGGVHAGGSELLVMGRASAFTVAAAVLGRVAIGLLARASLAVEQGPMAEPERTLGSLDVDATSTNVAAHEATSGRTGER